MIRNLPNIKPGDWITYKKGKSKSLHRGFSYRVEHDLSVHGIKGRGLTFEPTEAPIPYSGDFLRSNSSRLSEWLKNLLPEYSQQIEDFAPNNHVKELMVYINHANKRVPMTPGKAFRKIFNNFPDMGVETLVDLYKDEFGPEELTFHRSKDPDTFSQVYRMPKSTKRSNFMTTIWNKSLANSCMQKKYNNLKHHPAYAYGSGDFEIIWGENQQGQLACRTIVLSKENAYFPMYATSKQAMNEIQEVTRGMISVNCIKDCCAKFRLEKAGDSYYYSSRYLLPYVDHGFPLFKDNELIWKSDWERGERVLYPGTSGFVSV